MNVHTDMVSAHACVLVPSLLHIHVIVLIVQLHPNHVEAMQAMEDIKRRMKLPSRGMPIVLRELQTLIDRKLVRSDTGVLPLEQFGPVGIDARLWWPKVLRAGRVHLSVQLVASLIP